MRIPVILGLLASLLLPAWPSSTAAQVRMRVEATPLTQRQLEPIEIAAAKGQTAELRQLFPQASAIGRLGALSRALDRDDMENAHWLLEQGVRPVTDSPREQDPLGTAASRGNAAAVALLCRYGADPNRPGAQDRRPLSLALQADPASRADTVKALLACGADPRLHEQSLIHNMATRSERHGDESMLEAPVRRGDIAMVRLLLKHGAKVVEGPDCCAERLLSNSAFNPEMFSLLMAEGGAQALGGRTGAELLEYLACTGGDGPQGAPRAAQMQSLRLLLASRPALEGPARAEASPLACAAGNADPEIVHLLLDAGAEVNAMTRHRQTALGRAVDVWEDTQRARRRGKGSDEEIRARTLEVAKLLIAHGASPAVEQKIWRYPRAGRDDEMARLLAPVAQAWYAQLLRECLGQAPTAGTPRLATSGPGSAPGRAYAVAAVTPLSTLPLPVLDFSFSPDGRWLAYESRPGPQALDQAVLHRLADGSVYRYDAVPYLNLDWSADSRALSLDRGREHVIDLSSKTLTPGKREDFVVARRRGEEPCLSVDRNGEAWPLVSGDSGDRRYVYAPVPGLRYEMLSPDPSHQELVATLDGDKERLLVHEAGDYFRTQVAEQEKLIREVARERQLSADQANELRTALSGWKQAEKVEAGHLLLSPTGRYLFYSVQPDRAQESVQLVVDVQARPVRVWEIRESVEHPRWHPNGRELWFVTASGAETGPPMNRQRTRVLAVAAFPG